MKDKHRQLYDSWKYKKWSKNLMEFNNPVIQALFGLVIFYIGLKMFSGGMKSMGKLEHLEYFIHNPYWMFLGGIVCTLLWQSSSLSTTAIIGLVASGALPLPSANRCSTWSQYRYYRHYLVGRYHGIRWNATRNH